MFLIHGDEETFLSGKRRKDSICNLADGTVVPIDVMMRWRCGSRLEAIVLDARGAVLQGATGRRSSAMPTT